MPLYQHGKRTRQARNAKVFLGIAAVVGVSLVLAAFIISKDIGNSTAPKTNVPIVTNIGEDEEEKLKVSEQLFLFELPRDWKLYDKRTNEDIHFYRWGSTKKGA